MKMGLEYLPIYGVEHDVILSKRGDITLVYRLDLPEIFTLSGPDYEHLHQLWIRAIQLLPVGVVLHKQDWFVSTTFAGDFEKERDCLSLSSERFFHERPFLQHQSFLMLTLPTKDHKSVNSFFSSLLRGHLVPVETIDPAYLRSFETTCAQFVQVLCESKHIQCSRLSNESLVQLIDQYLRLDSDKVHRDLDFSEGVKVGEKHCTLYSLSSLKDFPTYCGPHIRYESFSSELSAFPIGFTTVLGPLLPFDHLYQQFLTVEDASLVAKDLEKRKLRYRSLAFYGRENQVAMDSTEQFLQKLVQDGLQPVRAHFHVLAWVKDRQQEQALRNACTSALSTIDVHPKIETVGAPQIFWAGIPGNALDLPVNETVLLFSCQAACFLHQETQYRDSESSFGFRLGDRISGRPLHVDLSDEPMQMGWISNRNKFILGPSGSGKSFFTNHLLRSYYYQGAHIVLVDIGHSYKGLCALLGGTYFHYGTQQHLAFNPFQGDIDSEKMESIKALLVTLWKKENESFKRSEYVALSHALQLYFVKDVPNSCFNSFYEFLKNDFSKMVQQEGIKEADFDLSNLLYVLKPFYQGGEFDTLLNAQENLNLLDQRFIVFELDTIKDHPILFPVVTIVIMELFLSKIRRLQGVRKVILIEEAWKAIAKAGMAEYIRYLYKTIRKHFGEPIIVTQELDDIISSEIVKNTIIAQSDCKILFDQSRYAQQFTSIQQLLGLTEKEKMLLLSLNHSNEMGKKYKEVFVSLGGRHSKVYRVEVSPEEYLAYTTEEKEKVKVLEAFEKTGNMPSAIHQILYAND